MKKYRVVKEEVGDQHFMSAPDEVLYEDDHLQNCRNYARTYKINHIPGWYRIVIQEQVVTYVEKEEIL